MNTSALRILRTVAKAGELPLETVLKLTPQIHNDHRDQYALALLIEDEYLGYTVKHTPPEGAEKMREFNLAITLHMETLPRKTDGSIEYLGIQSTGSIDQAWKKVFLKAKGALYLDAQNEKRKDRIFSLLIVVISAYLAAWLRSIF